MDPERTYESEPYEAFEGDLKRFKVWIRGALIGNSRTKEFKWSVTDRNGKVQIRKTGAWSEFWSEPEHFSVAHRIGEIWAAMPDDVKRDVLFRYADRLFYWLPYGDKMELVKLSGWTDAFIREDARETREREDKKWLRQAKRTLGQVKAILRGN
jgi:hypothetical protein